MIQQLNSFLDRLENPVDWQVFVDFLEDQGLSGEAELVRCQRLLRDNPEDVQARSLEEELLGKGVRPPVHTNSLGMRLARIPAGTFWMGGGEGRPGDKQVRIASDFFLGVHPVTQEQWQTLLGNNPSWHSRNGGGKEQVKNISDEDLRQFPVEMVSWNDAQEFIQQLNARESPGDWVYRLPTDAEWEYACRGGATTQRDCSFHFYLDRPSNTLSSRQANFDGNYPCGNVPEGLYHRRTTRVGSYRPNRLGLFDMHGNVWEWCQDWYEQGSTRLYRGGGWNCAGSRCCAPYRIGGVPSRRYDSLGFRLARVLSGR